MSLRNRRSLSSSEPLLGRRRQARRVCVLVEALEKRRLLSQPYVWNNVGVGGTGTDYCPTINPHNVNEIYLESDMGETWHTTNGGLVWQTLNQNLQIASQQAEVAVQFTSNQNTQYVLNGGQSPTAGSPMITTDDGLEWNVVSGWSTISSNGAAVQLWADPNNATDLVVAQYASASKNYWIWYSSDSGATFQSITSSTNGTDTYKPWIAGIFWDPNGSNAYVATNFGLWTTTNLANVTPQWNQASGAFSGTNETYFSFTGSDQSGTTDLWTITENQSQFTGDPGVAAATASVGLYRSSDGGASWTNETNNGPTVPGHSQQPWNDAATNTANLNMEWVQMADGNINDVWIGGQDYTYTGQHQGPIVYESTNATNATPTWNRNLHTGADSGYFGETPNQNVYTHTYGSGGPDAWGLGSAVSFFVDRANSNYQAFTVQDTVFATTDGGTDWWDIDTGSPGNQSFNFPNSFWNPEGTAIARYASVPSSTLEETTAFNLSFVSPTTIFADMTDVAFEQTSDGGAHWNYPYMVNWPNTFYQSAYNPENGLLYAVGSNKHNLYGDTDDGAVENGGGSDYFLMSSDGGENWTVLYTFPKASACRTMALDPNDPNIAFVGTANHNPYPSISTTGNSKGWLVGGGLWMTTDLQSGASATWTYLGDGSGATATATEVGGSIPSSGLVLNAHGTGYNQTYATVVFSGGLSGTGTAAVATATVTSGQITALNLINGGSGYTGNPTVTLASPTPTDQPERAIGTNAASFSAMHPVKIDVLNSSGTNGQTINVVAAMALRTESDGITAYENAGVWYGTTTNGGTTWTWTDESDPSANTFTYNGTSVPNQIPYQTYGLTIDPNDPTQNTWFVTEADPSVENAGEIYKTTDGTCSAGATWSVYSTIGQSYAPVWIQPGGKTMLFGAKNVGIDYVPDYTAANPQFYTEQSFPFRNTINILSNPFNSNQIWVDSGGNGNYYTDISQLSVPATPLNVTVQSVNSSEAVVNWTTQAPLPTSFTIEAATNSTFTSGTVTATVPNWQDSSYLFTGLSANTLYYFRMEAVNSSGNSQWSSEFPNTSTISTRTDAAANLLASEQFNYTVGAALNGQTGGTGWGTNAWSAASSATITASITGFPNTPPTDNGNAVYTGANATRTMASTVGQSGKVVWAAFEENLQNSATTLLFGNTTTGFGFGAGGNWGGGSTNVGFDVYSGGTATYLNTSARVSFSPSSSHFFVAEMDFESSGTYVTMFLDPTAGLSEPPINSSSELTWNTPPTTFAGSVMNNGDTLFIPSSTWMPTAASTVMLVGKSDYSALRVGNTYADVAPLSLGAPGAPTGLSATAVSANEIDLTWNNTATNQTGVFIEQSTDNTTWTSLEKINDPTAMVSSYDVSNLGSANTKYYFRVGSYNSGTDNGSNTAHYTASVNATTTSVAPPAVSNLSVTATSSQFDLSWSASSGATGYKLQYVAYGGGTSASSALPGNDGEFNWTTVSLGNTTAHTLSGLTAGTLYYFRIYADNTGGNSFCSNIVSDTISTTIPAAPSNLVATASTSAYSIGLAWTSNSGGNETGFEIERSTDGGVTYNTSYASVGSGVTAYTDTGLSADTTYYYEVNAYNGSGHSGNSNASHALTIPAVPTGLSAVPGTSTIVLTWSSNTNESSYTIQSSTDDSTWSNLVTGISNTATTYTDSTPVSGTTYYYQIKAVNATGSSAYDTIPDGLAGGVATVYAYEGFNYATSSTWNGNNTTGLGFTGNWTISNSSYASIASGLTYSSGTNALTTSGNALKFTNNDTATQTLSNAVGASGSTLWIGFEFVPIVNGGEELQIGSGTSTGYVDFGGNTVMDEVITTNNGTHYDPGGGYTGTAGTTYFIVGEIQYLSSSPVVTMWVDPTPNSANGAAPTGYLASITKTIPSTGGSFNSTPILILYATSVATVEFDEIRLGATYASVAPDPLLTGGSAGSERKKSSPRGHPSPFLSSVVPNRFADVVSKPATAAANHFYPDLNGGAWQWADAANDVDSVLLGTTSKNGLFN